MRYWRTFQTARSRMEKGGMLTGIFSKVFGVGHRSGIALLYPLSSLGLIGVGLLGYSIFPLQNIETLLTDAHNSDVSSS